MVRSAQYGTDNFFKDKRPTWNWKRGPIDRLGYNMDREERQLFHPEEKREFSEEEKREFLENCMRELRWFGVGRRGQKESMQLL